MTPDSKNNGVLPAGSVSLGEMADLAQSRIAGRAEGAGTGAPTALTPAQVVAIIDAADGASSATAVPTATDSRLIWSLLGL